MLKIGRPVHSIIGKRKGEDAKTLMKVMTGRKYTQEKIQTKEKIQTGKISSMCY